VALAGWVDASAGLFAFPLAVATGLTRWVLDPGPGGRRLRAFLRTPYAREMALAAALTFGGTVFAMALQELSPYQTTAAVFPSPMLWWDNLARAGTRSWSELAPREWAVFLAGCLAVAVVLLAFRRTRPAAASSLVVVAAVLATTAAYFVFMTVMFDSKWRYAIPAFVAAHVALVGAVVRPLVLAVGERARRVMGWALLAAVVASGMVFGPPSVAGVRAALDELDGRRTDWQTDPAVPFGGLPTCDWSNRWAGKRADAVVVAGCTHVAGPYWPTVPVVLRVVWGLTPRFEPVAAKWRAVSREQVRVASLNGEGREAEQYLGFRFVPTETVGPIRVLVPAPE
jgi:hypothetical protein